MDKKYLPIGSVCTIKGKNKKVMITGFYSVEFTGNLKIKDYSGCAFPEGLLLPEFNCTFNHSDIETVDFIGFKNEEQSKFSNLLDELTGNNEVKNNDWTLASNESYSKILFDENGVVVLAEPVEKKEQDEKIEKKNDYEIDDEYNYNPFFREYDMLDSKEQTYYYDDIINNNIEEVNIDEREVDTLNKIELDEDGEIISREPDQKSNFSKYRFDENGILVEILEDYPEENSEDVLE